MYTHKVSPPSSLEATHKVATRQRARHVCVRAHVHLFVRSRGPRDRRLPPDESRAAEDRVLHMRAVAVDAEGPGLRRGQASAAPPTQLKFSPSLPPSLSIPPSRRPRHANNLALRDFGSWISGCSSGSISSISAFASGFWLPSISRSVSSMSSPISPIS